MSKPAPETNPLVIDCPDTAPEWDAWGTEVRKIVLGQLSSGEKKRLRFGALPPNLAKRFPLLTHLYLWNIEGPESLPILPGGLECLDVRGCGDLTKISSLPATLDTLVLEDCAVLADLPALKTNALPDLADLSVQDCGNIPTRWIEDALASARALRRFDASGCGQIMEIESWPPKLERIDLNRCSGLTALPKRWPKPLRRLGLRGAEALEKLEDLPEGVDYLDLVGTRSLAALPRCWGRPRTLFLHGSGVLMPPASEHGKDASENVAVRTRAYFDDVALVGPGEVRRCKLLFLGNGDAGKTNLALRLLPGKDPNTDNPGTTHGVQFWDWDIKARMGGSVDDVHLHLWDFGGQEIYHNTHRLFMGKGAVFVLLWKPEQDGKRPEKSAKIGYQDEWRPLQYWLDLIHLACPYKPRIAIVCSHHDRKTPALEKQWQDQVTARYHSLRCFYIDSASGTGQIDDLKEWLGGAVGQVVGSQGVAVPSYWEIAQNMVESWFPKKTAAGDAAQLTPKYKEMKADVFGEELSRAIAGEIAGDVDGRWGKLSAASARGEFELTTDRIQRVLGFLTHGGWVYWDPDLFEQRVIIGQQWALQGIYTVLDRRTENSVYDDLKSSRGQFTRKQLDEWGWKNRYSPDEQKLLLTFMQSVGVCFELVSGSESRWGEPVYRTFEHLPPAKELDLTGRFAPCADQAERQSIECSRLHKGHWQAMLKELGERFGTDAEYASDGFLVTNKEGQTILLTVAMEKTGLGGHIDVQVAGPKAGERVKAMEVLVRRFLPADDIAPKPPEDTSPGGGAGEAARLLQVFVSYTWEPQPEPGAIPKGYEVPVDCICKALSTESVKVWRDKDDVKSGDSITAFMQLAKTTDKVLVIHSDKYWRSPFCMYEFWQTVGSLVERHVTVKDLLVLVEHIGSGFTDDATVQQYVNYWQGVQTMPGMLRSVTSFPQFKAGVLDAFENQIPKIAALKDRNLMWDDAKEAEIIAWVKERIGLAVPTEGKPQAYPCKM